MIKKSGPPHIIPLRPIPTVLQPLGDRPNKVDAILFDIYGTLFISASGDISLAQRHPELGRVSSHSLLNKYGIATNPGRLKQMLLDTIDQHHRELKAGGTEYPEVRDRPDLDAGFGLGQHGPGPAVCN